MPHKSPGLITAIQNPLGECGETPLASLVLSALVHGWYEGHIDGESTRRTPALASSQAVAHVDEDMFPSPPFPDRHSPELRELLEETKRRFDMEALAPGAIAYAAGLGWSAGFREGQKCHGCSFRGADPTLAARWRRGEPLSVTELMTSLALSGLSLDDRVEAQRRKRPAAKASKKRATKRTR